MCTQHVRHFALHAESKAVVSATHKVAAADSE